MRAISIDALREEDIGKNKELWKKDRQNEKKSNKINVCWLLTKQPQYNSFQDFLAYVRNRPIF